MNFSTIRSALYTWANGNVPLGTKVVWAEQNAPAPSRPYVTMRLTGPFRVAGADELRENDTKNGFNVIGPRRLTLQVQVFGNPDSDALGDTALGIANGLNFSLGKQATLEAFAASNLAVANEGSVENITGTNAQGFQPRFTFSAELLTVENSADGVGYIAEFEGVEGTFTGGAND